MTCHIDRPTGFWKVIVTVNGVETVFSEPKVRTAVAEIPESATYKIEVTGYTKKAKEKEKKSHIFSTVEEVEKLNDGCRINIKTATPPPWFYAILVLPFLGIFFGHYLLIWIQMSFLFIYIGIFVWQYKYLRKRAFVIKVQPA